MKIAYLCIFILSFAALGGEKEGRRNEIIKIINEELFEVQRLSKQGANKDPDLMLRIAELNLEKARLYREKENNSYLSLSAKKRSTVNKKKYFSHSSTFFDKADKICLKIVRRFKNYSKVSDVYYILGYNAKEANKSKTAMKYLNLARKAPSKGITKTKSQISLAEIYYNDRKYHKAIPLYKNALSKWTDKWWTKDSFNLAWSYFRVGQHSKAIKLMQSIYLKSKKEIFIDMRSQVERDIGLFFATSGRILDGIRFYKKLKINFTSQLMSIATTLVAQGQYSKALKVLGHALAVEKNTLRQGDIYAQKLKLFSKFGKYTEHRKIVNILFSRFRKNAISEEQVEILKFQLEKTAAILQRQVLSKTYKRLKKQRELKSNQSIAYFEMLAVMISKRSDEFKYLKGETAYAAKMYSLAYTYYQEAFDDAVKNKRNRFKKRSANSMLESLSHLKNQAKRNIYVFELFLQHWPKSKESRGIYVRLFNNYIASNDFFKAKTVLDRMILAYPKSKDQEGMIAKLMDEKRRTKDNIGVRRWISQIDAGVYIVSSKYKKRLQKLLTRLQIEEVQLNLDKGNKKVALLGYLDIVQDKLSTKKSKINSKYNLAALYFELGDANESYRWASEAISDMKARDVLNFSKSFMNIGNFLFASLEFLKSAQLSHQIFNKICHQKSKKKKLLFKNAAFIYLAQARVDKVEEMLKSSKRCKVKSSVREEIQYELMREYYSQQMWRKYEKHIRKLIQSRRYSAKMMDEILNLITKYERDKRKSKTKKWKKEVRNLYYISKKNGGDISLRVLDYFSDLKVQKMKKTIGKLHLLKLAFPERIFQKRVETKIKLLDKLVEQGNDVLEVGSGKGIVDSYRLLRDAYTLEGRKLQAFTPPGKTAKYIEGFKKQFKQIGAQMISAGKSYKDEGIRSIRKNSILSKNNMFFQRGEIPVEFFGISKTVLMDRGGRQ